jgi:hypothetical protein
LLGIPVTLTSTKRVKDGSESAKDDVDESSFGNEVFRSAERMP